MKTNRPLIGIVPDFRQGSKTGYSIRDYFAVRKNHIDTINNAGGAAVILTYDYKLIDSYLERLDGLVIVGGYFDINPAKFGEEEIHHEVKLNEVRENFEYELGKAAMKTDVPFLGICNGMQLLNSLHNGKIIQHIPDIEGLMNHEQSHKEGFGIYETPYHDVIIEKNSKLFEIVGEEKIQTNSSHHQAAKSAGDGLQITARASDGVIEALEKPDHSFCLGVQWHPEFEASEADTKIFDGFVKACKTYKKNKK